MSTDNITIEKENIAYAYEICKDISDSEIKNRAVENVVAGNIAWKFFDSSLYEIDVKSGLHNIAEAVEDLNISDIYINGAYIDVRLYFEGTLPVVPAIHFKKGILPVAYMFVKVSSDLNEANLTGFILPEYIKQTDADFYTVDEASLSSIYDIEKHLVSPQSESITELEIFKFAEGCCYNKFDFYKRAITSKEARMLLIKSIRAKNVFNMISIDQQQAKKDDLSEIVYENADDIFDELNVVESNDETSSYEYDTVAAPTEDFDDLETEVKEYNAQEVQDKSEDREDSEQIDALFNSAQEEQKIAIKKKNSPLLLLLLVVLIIGAVGYYGYNIYYQSQNQEQNAEGLIEQVNESESSINNDEKAIEQANSQTSAMPVEDVNTQPQQSKEEANSVAIPEIERNLDASVLVSNLHVDWEVPSGYASNTAAKRYLEKLGKIIQLNLKTELLLLTKPPISNKVLVEVKYNDSIKKFEPVGITVSSGEKSVDDTIMQTVRKALNMNISVNTSSFNKLQGNPVLIIRL